MNHKIIKAVWSFFTALILACLCTGCAKNKIPQVTNNKGLEQLFYGTWTVGAESTVELYANAGTDDEKYAGKAVILSSNILQFSENQVYSMEIASSIQSLTLTENSLYTEEEVTKQLENSIVINGKFSVDDDYLELLSETVVLNNTTTYSAAEYAQMDSTYGSEKQVVKWNLLGDSLDFADLAGNVIVTYNRN